MKKYFLVFLALFTLLFLVSGMTYAADLVPCGQGSPTMLGADADGNPIQVPDPNWHRCEFSDIFVLILNVYNFILLKIATPFAGLMIVIGGVMLLASGGNPNLASLARRILWGAFLGILLIFGAWLIVHTVLFAVGYTGPI